MRFEELIHENKIVLYGLGTETERFIKEYKNTVCIEGLLDGFKNSGEMYGYPIIPLDDTIKRGVHLIVVVARPGSCKAIKKRIGTFCKDHNISLFDIRGNDLLSSNKDMYSFTAIEGECLQNVYTKIYSADVISFDLFDTLVTRKVLYRKDIFDLMDIKLRDMGINILDFSEYREGVEKELSKKSEPNLIDVYKQVLRKAGGKLVSADELVELEFELDLNTLSSRKKVCEIYDTAIKLGKEVVITTDSNYTLSQIEFILDKVGISRPRLVLNSYEYGTRTSQKLYEILCNLCANKKILHIGNEKSSDFSKAKEYGVETCQLYTPIELFDSLGGLGIKTEIKSISDHVKVGMFVSELFNNPFWFEETAEKLSISNSLQIGYLFCAPMITDFILWMKNRVSEEGINQILFCSRDGYLPGKLFRKVSPETRSIYFLSSRTSAIRAGIDDEKDIEYVDSMKYFGTEEENLKNRFGIAVNDIAKIDREKEIIHRSKHQRENYKKYIETLNLNGDSIGVFDFVAKGTTQMFLKKLFQQHLKGFYFMHLEPEYMSDKELDIEAFYSWEQGNYSAVFENYYIIETILTAPHSQLEEFDENGTPLFAEETRSHRDIDTFVRAQSGITEFFTEYLQMVPDSARISNKKLDEKLLDLINHILIKDTDFMAMNVEDPFFGRMTDIKDVIGD